MGGEGIITVDSKFDRVKTQDRRFDEVNNAKYETVK